MLQNIKPYYTPIFFIAVVVLTGLLGFGLGRLSRIEEAREPVRIIQAAAISNTSVSTSKNQTTSGVPIKPISTSGVYVASKSGTRYYLPSCSGVSRIKEENKVYFATKEEAERAGLKPAANCI
jgi:hypothetical protein